jgi:ureidoacrylate peracid hydrolase
MVSMTRRELVSLSAASVALAGVSVSPALAATGRRVTLAARPAAVTLDTSKSAVIVVDMQNDFGSIGGMFDRAGSDISGIQKVVPSIARALEAARRTGIRVVYLKMGFKPDLSDLGASDSVNRAMHLAIGVGQFITAPDGRPGRVLIRDTWNTDIIPALQPHAGDLVLYKTRFSGFYNTDLHERLSAEGIRHLILAGCTTSVCVESTVRDAMFRDYLPVLLSDCMAEVVGSDRPFTSHQSTLALVEARFGWVSNSEVLVKALGA